MPASDGRANPAGVDADAEGAAPVVVVMGVSGSGKSTIGRGIADALGVEYLEGDDLHPARNKALMAAGTPLTDDDRRGWLQAIADRLAAARADGRGLVAGCSALKRSYRDVLRSGAPGLRFVHLHGDTALLAARMHERSGHYMPTSLLQSQLDTLEPPQADERAITIDIDAAPERIVATALHRLETSAA